MNSNPGAEQNTVRAFAAKPVGKRDTGQVAERSKAADCKSADPCGLRRFEPSPVHQRMEIGNWTAAAGSGFQLAGNGNWKLDKSVAQRLSSFRFPVSKEGRE